MRKTKPIQYAALMVICALFSVISVSVCAADNGFVPGELIVKFKADKASSGISALSQTPVTFKELSGFLGAKSIKPLFKDSALFGRSSGMIPMAAHAHRKLALRQKVFAESGLQNVYQLAFDVSADISTIARQLQNDPSVEYAELNYIAYVHKVPNDPRYLDGLEWHINKISCPGGWDVSTGDSSIIVAVIDSGISVNHVEFSSRLLPGYNFVDASFDVNDIHGHGTMVSGIIGANGDNLLGIAGMDWNAKIMPLKAMDDTGKGTYADISNAIMYAIANGADIINMSLGGASSSSTLEQAIAAAVRAQLVCVVAMGNSGDNEVYYPAGYTGVIRVGALDRSDQRASFSTYGSGSQITELCAPGVDIISTSTANSGYAIGDGTSFSAPMVSGLCALILAKQPDMSIEDLRILLHATADDVGKSGPDKYCGFGRINVNNALKGIVTQGKGDELSQLMNFPNPANEDGTTFSFFLDDTADITVKVFTTHGELVRTITGGTSVGAYHKVPYDCADERGELLPNGSYIYVVIAEGGAHSKIYKKGKMAILR